VASRRQLTGAASTRDQLSTTYCRVDDREEV
jgi:hypothetical protein